MPLGIGTKLGPYEIVSPLGAGGMGEVYRARDTRLDRTVAIKVLPSHLSDNAELRKRFEQEARAVSSLNHPHICTLHDIGDEDGIDFMVMEYIDGETLADRLKKGPLPLEQALKRATEIADALDKAHRQRIVHRDLKPANIMLTKSGAKVLDFGLATRLRQGSGEARTPDTSNLPTEAKPLTEKGTILGTFQYMAPEQLEGQDADARTDIFAFGAVLYEMVTGRKAFEGGSQASLITAIMSSEPTAISELRPMSPPGLDRLVKTCLLKDAEERCQNMHDVLLELNWIAEAGSEAQTQLGMQRRKHPGLGWALAAFFLLLSLGVGVIAVRNAGRATSGAQPIRALISEPEGASFRMTGDTGGPATISPDGRHLAFAAATGEETLGQALWVRSLDSLSARELPGTERARFPFWSADSRSIGFFANGKLKTIAVSGGPALTVCDAPTARGGTWSRDDVILFTPQFNTGIYRVPASGGEPTPVTQLDDAKSTTHRWPYFLPDGRHFLYLAAHHSHARPEDEAVYFASLDGKETRLGLRTNSRVVYASGHLLFVRDTILMAQRFNTREGELSGEPFPIAEDVQLSPGTWHAIFTASANGILAYQTGEPAQGTELLWFDRSGNELGVVDEDEPFLDVALSPDEKSLAVTIGFPGLADIWIYDLSRGVRTRFTFDPGNDMAPIWSRDGSSLLWSSNRAGGDSLGGFDIYRKPSSGAGSTETLTSSAGTEIAADWSPDGRFIAYVTGIPGVQATDIWILPLGGNGKPYPFVVSPFDDSSPQFSPDGRWLAYRSTESGTYEVFVVPFRENVEGQAEGKWQVSTGGGDVPRWRRDGKEIFYMAPNIGTLMATTVDGEGSTFEIGVAHPLFTTRMPAAPSFDVSPDGQRFLVNNLKEQDTPTPITLVVNWTAELQEQ